MKTKVFITGISGFAGSFLAEHLVKQDKFDISGAYLSDNSLEVLREIRNCLTLHKVDLTDFNAVEQIIKDEKPEWIFHLAALTSPAESFANPSMTINNNIDAQINILEAVKNNNLSKTKILIVGSAEAYGQVKPEDLPINESLEFKPRSPYAVSKITQDFLALQYFLASNLQTFRVRPFNHIGPRQSERFVVSAFAKQIAEIEKGSKPPEVTVGNLDSKRDFTDVRDIVVAYQLILEKGIVGDVYNLGSGKSYKISDILDILIAMSSKKIEVKINRSLFHPGDIPELLCDNRKIKKTTAWEPKFKIEETLKDTLDYWRNVV